MFTFLAKISYTFKVVHELSRKRGNHGWIIFSRGALNFWKNLVEHDAEIRCNVLLPIIKVSHLQHRTSECCKVFQTVFPIACRRAKGARKVWSWLEKPAAVDFCPLLALACWFDCFGTQEKSNRRAHRKDTRPFQILTIAEVQLENVQLPSFI